MRDLLWRVCFRWKFWPQQVTGDTTYGTTENIVAIEDAGIRAYVPLPDFERRTRPDDALQPRRTSPYSTGRGVTGSRTATRGCATLIASAR